MTSTSVLHEATQAATQQALEMLDAYYTQSSMFSEDPNRLRRYAESLTLAHADTIPEAAKVWMSHPKHDRLPEPVELAGIARDLTQRMRRGLEWRMTQPEDENADTNNELTESEALIASRNTSGIDAASNRAYAQLGSWHLVGVVWSLYCAKMRNTQQLNAYRRGKISDSVFDRITREVAARNTRHEPEHEQKNGAA